MNLVKEAYEAYSSTVGGQCRITGDILPPFEELPPNDVGAWQAAVDAVITAYDSALSEGAA